MIFDEDYTGQRFRYGLQYRPVGSSNIPNGWIIGSQKTTPDFVNFGTVDYSSKLTEAQIQSFQLVFIGEY